MLSNATVLPFKPFAGLGWRLTRLKGKRPLAKDWNRRENTIDGDDYLGVGNVGLAHAYSGTACIDVDDIEQATPWCAERGIDLQALLDSPDAVRIDSGRENRTKLLYALAVPIPSSKISIGGKDIIDFRCGTKDSLTVQDVLPPSVHPDTVRPYEWAVGMMADWRSPPALPDCLLRAWEAEINTVDAPEVPKEASGMSPESVRELLFHRDPDASRKEWVEDAMVIKHELGDTGFDLFVEWSRTGTKFSSEKECRSVWRSARGSANPRTVASWTFTQDLPPPGEDEFDAIVVPKEKQRLMPVQIGTWSQGAEQSWLVEGLIPDDPLGMIYGEPGAGKSFLSIDIAMSIGQGTPWRSRAVSRRPVVYIAAEAAGGVKRRFRGYAKAFGIDLDTVPVYGIDDSVSLVKDDYKILIERLQAIGPRGVAIIDTLSQALGGADENASDGMGKAVANATRLARMSGWQVILVHHPGKDVAKGARGWSGLRAACDFELEVTKAGGDVRTVRITKMKDGSDQGSLSFRLQEVELGVNNLGKVSTTCVISRETVFAETIRTRPSGPRIDLVFKAMDQLGAGMHPSTQVMEIVRSLRPSGNSTPSQITSNFRATVEKLIEDQWLDVENDKLGLVQ